MAESTPVRRLVFRATVLAKPEPGQTQTPNYYPLFAEPAKGDFANFYGFYAYPSTGELQMKTRSSGVETRTNSPRPSAQLLNVEHTYEIRYQTNQVEFFYDGRDLAVHTTNISTPPHELETCESDGNVMSLYLKHPYLTSMDV